MSITINGATNTITAASGLTIAGNTAVTGTLSATGNTTFSGVTNAAQGVKFTTSFLGSASDYYVSNYLTNIIYNAPTGSGHVWAINNGDKMTLSSTGLAVTGLLDLSAASSGQIKFPASQNASADANTLDDYEEGTFTPTIGSGSGTITSSTATGSYTKIGRKVHVSVNISITNAGTGAGALTFSVPFTSLVGGNSYAGSGVETAAVGFTGTCYIGANSTTVSAYKDGFLTPIGTGNGLIYSITYFV